MGEPMNSWTRLSVWIASALIASLGSTAFADPVSEESGPNLVTNGGFENTPGIAGSGWTPSGFFFEGFDYFIDSNPADAHSGNRSFAGGGIGAPGFISQTLTTVPGASYNIHLWLANLSGFASGTEIQVLWGGNLVYSASDILGFGYSEIVIDPIATSLFTDLSIGLRDDSFFLNLDDVSVFHTPEPATLALLLGGLGAAGLARRGRPSA